MNFKKPQDLHKLLQDFDEPWCIAGGWGLDLFFGIETRPHKDIEIAILRKDQKAIKEYFYEFDFYYMDEKVEKPWHNSTLKEPIHEIHAVTARHELGEVEILLNENVDDHWVYRRHHAITKPMNETFITCELGIPILAPEIILLYKAKDPREIDNTDLWNALPDLSIQRRKWLHKAVTTAHPEDTNWIELIEKLV